MVTNFFKWVASGVANFVKATLNLPAWIKQKFIELKEHIQSLHYRLQNIKESNMELGIYHLYRRNFSDAIFRFKMVLRFFDQDNKEANYWLGWVYFLKNDYKKAAGHFARAGEEDKVQLGNFITNIQKAQKIPDDIYAIYRNIHADLFKESYISGKGDVPKELILLLNQAITKLPDKYKILDLGSNIGLLGAEARKRMQEEFKIIGVEVSTDMIDLQDFYFPEEELYDKVINLSISDFAKINKDKYDVILSLNGLDQEADIEKNFKTVSSMLKASGYFAFAAKVSGSSGMQVKELGFSYTNSQIKECLQKNKLNILASEEITLEIKNKYSIFVCKK